MVGKALKRAFLKLDYGLNTNEGKLKTSSGIHNVKICNLPFHDKEKNIPIG